MELKYFFRVLTVNYNYVLLGFESPYPFTTPNTVVDTYQLIKPIARRRLPMKTDIQQIGNSKINTLLQDCEAMGALFGARVGEVEGADDGAAGEAIQNKCQKINTGRGIEK